MAVPNPNLNSYLCNSLAKCQVVRDKEDARCKEGKPPLIRTSVAPVPRYAYIKPLLHTLRDDAGGQSRTQAAGGHTASHTYQRSPYASVRLYQASATNPPKQ